MVLKKRIKRRGLIRFTVAVLSVLFLDQTSKFAVTEKIVDVDVYENYGALFGMPLSSRAVFYFSAILLIACFFYFKKNPLSNNNKTVVIAAGFMFGGIISNLIDRITHGYIIDYINLLNLFSFNIADASIYLGAAILSWKTLRK